MKKVTYFNKGLDCHRVVVGFRLAGLECGPKIPERDHESHRFSRTRIEAEPDVEFSRLLRKGVYNDPPNSDGIGRVCDAPGRIAKHGSSQPTSLVGPVYCQPSQDHDRNGIRHIPTEPPWNARLSDGA